MRTSIAIVLLLAAPTLGQVVARQAEDTNPRETRFVSPMELEMPFEAAARLAEGSSISLGDLGAFRCEDARFIAMKVEKSSERKSGTTFKFSGFIQVEDSFDRYATVRYTLLEGERMLGEITSSRIDAEERKSTPFSAKLLIPAERVASLRSPESPLRLRIVLGLAPNK